MELSKEEKLVAYIANPYFDYHPSLEIDKIPLEFIEKNKLSLILLEKGLETEIGRKYASLRERMLQELCELTHEFEKFNIDFVVIKFPELPRTHGDLDILIANGLERVEDVLRSEGYELWKEDEPQREGYRKNNDGVLLKIDIHTESSWGGIKYLRKEDIWENRVKREINGVEVPFPSPEYEFLITAAHGMRENAVTLFDVFYVNFLFKKGINMEFVKAVAKENNWLKQLFYFSRAIYGAHRELYDEELEFLSDVFRIKPLKIDRLPFHFPFRIATSLKVEKALRDLKTRGFRDFAFDLSAYFQDLRWIKGLFTR